MIPGWSIEPVAVSMSLPLSPLRRVALPVLAAAALVPPSPAQADATRRSGEVLSWALPAGVAAVELWRGDREGAWQFGQSLAVTLAATEVLKRSVHSRRPDGSDEESFPSGHASRAFAAATYVHRRHGFEAAWPVYLGAAWVGHSRVHADQHRWRDIAGSALLSAVSSWWLVTPAGGSVGVTLAPRAVHVAWQRPL